MNVTCPWCGASGVDDEPYPEPEEAPAFEMYGNYRGRPIRKCLKCGNGVSVAIFPRRLHKVQPDLWAQLQARWEEHRANVDVRAETVAEDQQTYRQLAAILGFLYQLTRSGGWACLALIPVTVFTSFDVLPVWVWPIITLVLWLVGKPLRLWASNARRLAETHRN